MPMNTRGQILLDLIAGLAGPRVKTAAVEVIRGGSSPQYRPLGGGGATVLGSVGGLSNPVTRAQYFSAVNGQSSRRSALGSSWMAQQGRVSSGVMRDVTALWKRDNAAILKSNPALGRYAGYFAANPGAWKRFQASAGIGGGAAPARTAASAPVARQAARQSAVARPQLPVSPALTTKRQPVAAAAPAAPAAPARTAASAPVAAQATKQTQAVPAAGRPTFSDYMRGKVSYRDFMRAGRHQSSNVAGSPVAPVVSKATPAAVKAAPAIKPSPRVATWSPGQALPGMTMDQTKAYQSKLGKGTSGGTSVKSAQSQNGLIAEPVDLNRRLAAARDRNSRIVSRQQRAPVKPTTGAAMFGVKPQAAATPPAWKEQRAARRGQVDDHSTGNAYYDQLKSTVANQSAADRAKRWNEFMASQKDVTQTDDPRVAEEWAKHQKTWGQRLDSHPALKRIVGGVYQALSSPQATSVGGPSVMTDFSAQQRANPGFTPTITDEQAGDIAHDAANMLQKQWGNWSQGVEGFGRRVIGALDPRTWSWVSGPVTSRVYSQAHANARDNSDALQAAMNRKIDADNIVTGATGSPLLDKATQFISETGPRLHGEISAGTAALGGVTSAMGGIGGGIISGGAKLAPRAGQLAQRATGFLGNRASAAIGRGTASAVRGTTNAVATPFNMAAHPVRSTAHTLADGARGIADVARPAARTVKALMTPGRINYSHPSAWRTAANYWGGVMKPGAKAAWNYFGSPRFFVTKQLGQAGWHALEDGNFDRASGDLGGAYAWAGGFLPGMGYELYRGISDPYAE